MNDIRAGKIRRVIVYKLGCILKIFTIQQNNLFIIRKLDYTYPLVHIPIFDTENMRRYY